MRVMVAMVLMVVATACGSKESKTSDQKLAGETKKTWEAKKETTASGEKDKLTRDEKKERVTFHRDGSVEMGNGEMTQTGKWTLEGNTLSILFSGSTVKENFNVLAIEDDELRLQGVDGSEMILEPK
jgi:hypothetical protein